MKSLRRLTTVAVFSIVSVFCGCQDKQSEEPGVGTPDAGTIENSVYRNEYFAFTMNIPDGWHVQDDKAKEMITDIGQDVLVGEDKNLRAMADRAQKTTVNLLAVFEHPLGSPVPFNPSLMGLGEKVAHLPGIKTGKDYLFHARRVVERGQIEYVFPRETYFQVFDGVGFDVLDAEMSVLDMTVKQRFYSTIIGDYALFFVVSFSTEEESKSLEQVLQTINFD